MERWQTIPLGNLCDLVGGGTPSKSHKAFYEGDIPWATVRDMRQDVITTTEFRITQEAVASSTTNIIPAGNVVIATRVGLGKVCFVGQDTAINQDLRGVIPKDKKQLNVRFLYWWLKSIARKIEHAGTGATVQGVKLQFIQSLAMPVLPLPEQKRIVAILDEAFSGIDAAMANTEKNLANAREMFESYLNAIFNRRGTGWKIVQLGDIATVSAGNSAPQNMDLFENGIYPFVRTSDVGKIHFGSIADSVDKLNKNGIKQLRLFPKGTILFPKSGASTFLNHRVMLARDSYVASHLATIKANSIYAIDEYLLYFLFTIKAQDLIQDHSYPSLNLPAIQNITIPLPPLPEQKRIVAQLDELSAASQHLETIYRQKQKALEELKQALLHKAFSGDLTAQFDPMVPDEEGCYV